MLRRFREAGLQIDENRDHIAICEATRALFKRSVEDAKGLSW